MSRLAKASVLFLFLLTVSTLIVTFADDPEPAPPVAEQSGEKVVVEEVIPPQIIIKSQHPPDYPPAALAGRFEGVVVVELKVLKDGSVGDAKVVKCSHPNIGFEEAAIAATKKWRFEAALKNGEPIDYDSTFRVNFRVAGGGQPYVSWGAAGSPTTDTGGRPPVRNESAATSSGRVSK